MKTNAKWINYLKMNVLTEEMLEAVIYSANKRAKNCRNKKREYYEKGKSSSYRNDYAFKTVEKYKQDEKKYYNMKLTALTVLKPLCIHQVNRENESFELEEYYEGSDEFYKYTSIGYQQKYDKHIGDYYVEVEIPVMEIKSEFYLLYETLSYSFHIPISSSEIEKYNLPVIIIDDLQTNGKDIGELVSVQFIKKALELIINNNYKYVRNLIEGVS